MREGAAGSAHAGTPVPGRALAVEIDFGTAAPITVYSLYLVTGNSLCDANLATLAAVGADARSRALPFHHRGRLPSRPARPRRDPFAQCLDAAIIAPACRLICRRAPRQLPQSQAGQATRTDQLPSTLPQTTPTCTCYASAPTSPSPQTSPSDPRRAPPPSGGRPSAPPLVRPSRSVALAPSPPFTSSEAPLLSPPTTPASQQQLKSGSSAAPAYQPPMRAGSAQPRNCAGPAPCRMTAVTHTTARAPLAPWPPAAHLFREIIWAATAQRASAPAVRHILSAVIGTCDRTLPTLGPAQPTAAESWLRRCHSAATQLLCATCTCSEDLLQGLREDSEQAHDAATAAPNALRHASGDSWHDGVATASAARGGAAHAYIRGRQAWQPAVVRRHADLKPSGRTDYIIAHHTRTWVEHWCRQDLAHHNDAIITDVLAACPSGVWLPPFHPCADARRRGYAQSPHNQLARRLPCPSRPRPQRRKPRCVLCDMGVRSIPRSVRAGCRPSHTQEV